MNTSRLDYIIEDIQLLNQRKDISINNIEKAFIDFQLRIETEKTINQTEVELVESLLFNERRCFSNLFRSAKLRGNNAIEELLIVYISIKDCFDQVNPTITSSFKKYYPAVFEKHMKILSEFIIQKSFKNISKGISEGFYRNDLSPELLSRMYLKRFWDIMDPDLYNPEDLDFNEFGKIMFLDFYEKILTDDGRKIFVIK